MSRFYSRIKLVIDEKGPFKKYHIPGHSTPLTCLGAFILIIGFLSMALGHGDNLGRFSKKLSSQILIDYQGFTEQNWSVRTILMILKPLIAVSASNIIIGGSVAGLTSMFIKWIKPKIIHVYKTRNHKGDRKIS